MYVSTHAWKSSKCTPSAQPTPHSSSSVRPVNSSQVWLKNVQSASVPAIQSSTGATSAMMRKRASVSLARRSARRRRVVSRRRPMPPSMVPSAERHGR